MRCWLHAAISRTRPSPSEILTSSFKTWLPQFSAKPKINWMQNYYNLWIIKQTAPTLSANSSCVSHHGQRLCQTFLLQFRLLLWWVFAATDPGTYQWCSGLDSVVDFGKRNCNISSSQKPIIWFPELLFKFISGFNTVLGLSELIVSLRCYMSKMRGSICPWYQNMRSHMKLEERIPESFI